MNDTCRISRRIRFAAVGLLISVACPPSQTSYAQPPPAAPVKYALLIGINKYSTGLDVPTLSFAEADVDAMAEALKAVGYRVEVLKGIGTTRLAIVDAIQHFVLNAKPQDTFLLYLAGHGVRNPFNNKVYWLATDTALPVLEGSGIRMSHLLDYFADIKAARKVLLLDHCLSGEVVSDLAASSSVASAPSHSGGTTTPVAPPTTTGPSTNPAPPPTQPASRGPSGGAVRIERRNVEPIKTTISGQWNTVPGGTMILAAARDDAFESDTVQHGVFTAALLEALKSRVADTSGDGQLSADELRNYVHDRVPVIARTMLRPPQNQEVADYDNGAFASFTLTSTLPFTTAQEAKTESDRLKRLVSDWYGKRYMQPEDATFCYAALLKLVESKTTGAPLDPLDEGIIRALRDAASVTGLPEQARVDLLVQEIHRLRGVQ
jgi:uncharacterized caspase-like protein